MHPPNARHVAAGLLVCLLVGSAAILPAAASRPPEPVCLPCGEGFESAAADAGLPLDVEHSTATVRVHPNGSATWTVENRVSRESAAELRASPGRLRGIVRDLRGGVESRVAADRPVVVLRYREAEFARRTLGDALVVTELHPGWTSANYAGLGADRLTLVGPETTRVDSTLPGATVGDGGGTDGRAASGAGAGGGIGSEASRRTTLTAYDPGDAGFVVFAPRAALPSPLPTWIAIAGLVGPLIVRNALLLVGIPVAAFAGTAAAVSLGLRRSGVVGEGGVNVGVADRGGLLLVAAGVLVAACSPLVGGVPVALGVDPAVLGVGVGLVGFGALLWRGAARERATYRRLVAGAAAATGAAAALAAALAFAGGALNRWFLSSLPLLVAPFALVPAGYALGRGRLRLALATGAAGVAVAVGSVAPLTTPSSGYDALFVILATVSGVALAVLGAPLLVAGASFAAEERTGAAGRARTADAD